MIHPLARTFHLLGPGPGFVPLIALWALMVTEVNAADNKLHGCWLNDRVIQSGLQGTPKNKTIQCALFYDEKTMTTACPSEEKANSFAITSYTYEIIASGEYMAKFIRNDSAPHAAGSTLKYFYQVDAKSLFLLTFPRTATPVPVSRTMRDESVSLKVKANSKEDCLFKAVEKSSKSLGI